MRDQPELGPIERAVRRSLDPRRRMSRRIFLRDAGRGAMATGAVLSLPSILAACGIDPANGSPGAAASGSPVGGEPAGELVFANWQLYIDQDEETGESPTLQQFTDETGIAVDYQEAITDNNEFFGTIQPALSAGQDTGWDLIVMSDSIMPRLIRLGHLETIDVATSVPNFVANAGEAFKDPSYDPGNRHSVAWQSGITGIGYNPQLTGREITSFADLLDPEFSGRIGMFTDAQDSIGLALLHNGVIPEEATEDDVRAAVDVLREQAPLVRAYYGNEYAQELAGGSLALTMAYSGDVFILKLDNPELEFVVPEAGGILFTDNMCIPKRAQHPADALAMMEFVYRPEIAAQIAEYVNYICPVPAAQDIIRQHAAEAETAEDRDYLETVAESPLVFPDAEMLTRLHNYKALSEEEEALWNELYQEVTQG